MSGRAHSPARHGTNTGYNVDGCRCRDCRRAHADYQAGLFERRRALGVCRVCAVPVAERSVARCEPCLARDAARVRRRVRRASTRGLSHGSVAALAEAAR